MNLDGRTISGPGCDGSSVGITVSGSNVHVTGGTVKGFQTGVSVRPINGSAGHNQLSDLTVTESCLGIELRSSNNNHVNFNNVFRNLQDGVVVQGGSANNQVNFNLINENGLRADPTLNGQGILVVESDSNVVAFNVISRNEQGGVRLTRGTAGGPGSNNNTIASNIVTETEANEGIIIQAGNNNTIHGNLSSRNFVGIEIQGGATENFVLRNTALDNKRPDGDLRDENLNCDKNKWRANIFKKDNEGDGPGEGCIQ